MGAKRMAILTALALMASPIIFRPNYLSDKVVVRPMQKSLVGFSLAEINAFRRAQNPLLELDDYCYIEAMRRDALAVLDRKGQQQLELLYADLPQMSFDLIVRNGIRLTVGIYEKCEKQGDGSSWGSLLIASKGGKLLWADEFQDLPLYLYPSDGPHLAVLSSCMSCGDATQLFHDPINQKFYTQYVGD